MAIDVDNERKWEVEAKRLLRSEMMRQGISYEKLAEKLASIGVRDTPANLRNKVARGKFSAAFFLQCCRSLNVDVLHLH